MLEKIINSSNPLIRVRLSGGLGNQLFQFAAAQYVSNIAQSNQIILDSRFLNKYETPRNYELDFLTRSMTGVKPAEDDTFSLPDLISKYRFAKVVNRPLGQYALIGSLGALDSLVKYRDTKFYKHYILDGYFQNPNYLRLEEIKTQFNLIASESLDTIRHRLPIVDFKKCVGIHIRRGDYVNQANAKNKFLTIELAFYLEALKYFPNDSHYIIFGDDNKVVEEFSSQINGIPICKFNFSLSEEFILLSKMQNIIIANSTFSWWSAMIDLHSRKKIIAPKKWYKNEVDNLNNKLLLSNFVVI